MFISRRGFFLFFSIHSSTFRIYFGYSRFLALFHWGLEGTRLDITGWATILYSQWASMAFYFGASFFFLSSLVFVSPLVFHDLPLRYRTPYLNGSGYFGSRHVFLPNLANLLPAFI